VHVIIIVVLCRFQVERQKKISNFFERNEMTSAVSPHSSSIQEEKQPLVSHTDKLNEYGSASIKEIPKRVDSPKQKGLMSSLAVVYITVFIDLMGFGIIIPLLPYYALSLGTIFL
jgi:hypothetical protein